MRVQSLQNVGANGSTGLIGGDRFMLDSTCRPIGREVSEGILADQLRLPIKI
jgi:hypothetical protein